jgi:hypothetical protein
MAGQRLSPVAGLFNALARLYIRRARHHIAAQQHAIREGREQIHQLRTAADFRATEAAGYIDRSFLERR